MEQANVPPIKVPNWLNLDFLEKALRSHRNDASVKISNYEFGGGFGEHFGSQMYTCVMKFNSTMHPTKSDEILKVVVKVQALDCEGESAIIKIEQFFETEILMYKETLPLIKNLLARNGYNYDLAPE